MTQAHRTGLFRQGLTPPWQWLACLYLVFMAFPLQVIALEQKADVRVVIDVSGSMKKNDPQNLRAPALRLLVGLLPNGTKAGVWTFGKYVNMQVKLAAVDDAWKVAARKEAGKIHSRGLYTNIEEALIQATKDWQTPNTLYRRNLLLLTDGMVDISKDPALNAASRQRIIKDILPRLQQAGVSIHTIALSDNVDKELLNAMALSTDGWFEQVDNAKALQRVFLRLFEKSVPSDALPLMENNFTVDKNVTDMTILVFRAEGAKPTRVIPPVGEPMTQDANPKNVQWHHEESYDMVTVKKPAAGEWSLDAEVDPDNRVLVVTNLRLQVGRLPNNILLGDDTFVNVRLIQDGKTVTQPDLLSLVNFTLSKKRVGAKDGVQETKLLDDGQSPDTLESDGVYYGSLGDVEQAGNYEVIVQAQAGAFQREHRHRLVVYDSPAEINVTKDAGKKVFRITVSPRLGILQPQSVSVQARLPDDKVLTFSQKGEREWTVEVPADQEGETIRLIIAGTRYNHKPMKAEFKHVLAESQGKQGMAIKAKKKPEEKKPAIKEEQPQEDKESDDIVPDAEDEPVEEEFNWGYVSIIIVVANVIVFGSGAGVYMLWRRRKNKKAKGGEEEVDEELAL